MVTFNTRGATRRIGLTFLLVLAAFALTGTSRAADAPFVPKDGRIGYVLTYLYWAIYQSPDPKTDCPKGYNIGPRGQFTALFPSDRKHTVVESQLAQEVQTWHPNGKPDTFPYYEPVGHTALGLNLDGKTGPNDYTSPEGEQGIDNQLFRALGCVIGFRGPDGVEFIFENKAIATSRYNRLMIELSNVKSLVDDDNVTVNVYRGLDRLLTDASGNKIVAGGSQRIDTRWGRTLMRQMKGRIVNGVLTTEPIKNLVIPWMNLGVPTFQLLKDMRLRLKLTSTGAQGLIGGYADVDTWYYQLIRNDSTHHLSNGDISGISVYKEMKRLADAYPDPKTDANTAISSALDARFVQVYINPLSDAQKVQLRQPASASVLAQAGATR
jgi:hypothetical protein